MAFKDTVHSVLRTKGAAVWSVSPSASVFDALALMSERDVGAVVVASEGRLVGMFSERDYARKIALPGRSSKETLVCDVMTSPPVTVSPGQTVEECLHIMSRHRVRHLPVTDGCHLDGVISVGDLLHAVICAGAETPNMMRSVETGLSPVS
jgi:CBS domain-containing protein